MENITSDQTESDGVISFGRYEFVRVNPGIAVPVLIFISLASLVGTFGNVLTLMTIVLCRKLRNVESIFIINLALSDLYVTAIADPMSIVAKLEGEYFFDSVPKLCQVIASMCTISCVTSLMTISLMSLNRYVFICKQEYYGKVFTQRNSIIMCMSVYCIGLVLVLLNQAGIGDHSFDRKSLECIWDRMVTYAYTVVFSVTLVWIPSLVIGICYLKVFLFVRKHSKKMDEIGNRKSGTRRKPSTRRNLRLQVFKTMFIIYIVFVSCWAPYALIMIIDAHNTFPYELHVIITVFAHLHPSVNWLIYYKTQKRFAIAYRRVLRCCVKADSDWNSNQTALSGSRCQQSGTSEDVL